MQARAGAMEALGGRRLSVGGSLMRSGLAAIARAAQQMTEGRFDFADDALANRDLVERFRAGT